MNVEVFENAVKAAENFLLCQSAVDVFTHDLRDIDEAVKNRIRRQRGENKTRIIALREAANDPAASPTLRRMSALQLESCETATFTATVEEIKEFELAKAAAYDSLRDLAAARQEFNAALAAAEEGLKRLKDTAIPPTSIRGAAEDRIDRLVDGWEQRTISGNFA